MDWLRLLFLHPVSLYQGAALPFAFLFNYLCTVDSFSTGARYLFLLTGGGALALAAMGCYALLVFIPVLCTVLLVFSLGPRQVHRLTFSFQMGWQTLCHLGLHYTEYYLQEPPSVRFCIALSSLMLLTQRVTSLSLDIREGKVDVAPGSIGRISSLSAWLWTALPYCSYLLFFPALLGGPLCSFQRFRARVQRPGSLCGLSLWALACRGFQMLVLQGLKVLARAVVSTGPGLDDCRGLECIYVMWSTAGLFKLRYYSHWILDDSVLLAAGFGWESVGEQGFVPDADIWTLETTHRISLFARQWNRSTARWLRRLVFQQSRGCRVLRTFAFSAWWHGLHPGQVFGFLCWAAMVEADYLIHTFAGASIRSGPLRVVFKILTWALTQLIIGYIVVAVEVRSLSALWLLCGSYSSVFPAVYCALLVLLASRKRKCN